MKSFIQYIAEEDETYTPPASAANNAKKALKWKEEHGDDEVTAMTRTGWTRANQLADREEISYETVKRMHSFFSRHKGNEKVSSENEDTPWKDNGYVSFLGWGGEAGKNWAEKIVDQKEREKE